MLHNRLCERETLSNDIISVHLMQRQVSGEVQMQPQSSLVNPIAMMMATTGMGVSLYSARQMAERVHLKHQHA